MQVVRHLGRKKQIIVHLLLKVYKHFSCQILQNQFMNHNLINFLGIHEHFTWKWVVKPPRIPVQGCIGFII